MKKINFKNKPNTETPLSAANMNLLQQNVEEETIGNKALIYSVMGPSATGWQNSVKVPLDRKTVGLYPVILSIMYESSNGIWILVDRSDFQVLLYTLDNQLEIQLLSASRANVRVKVTILPTSAIKSGG